MTGKCKAVELREQGFLTDEMGNPIICPLRNANCNIRCAWFSVEGRVFRCKDAVVGAVRPGAVRSFRVHSGLKVYNLDELLVQYNLHSPDTSLAENQTSMGSEDSLGAAAPEEIAEATSRAGGYMNEESISTERTDR